jgi:hypothetical protein
VIETALERAAARGCRHSSATVRYGPERLELEIRADRRLPDVGDTLGSVSERVELYGGSLDVLDDERNQFAIRCVLPLEGTVAA